MGIAFLYAHKFTVVGMGEDFATNLGLDYKKIVNLGLIIVSIVTVCVVLLLSKVLNKLFLNKSKLKKVLLFSFVAILYLIVQIV